MLLLWRKKFTNSKTYWFSWADWISRCFSAIIWWNLRFLFWNSFNNFTIFRQNSLFSATNWRKKKKVYQISTDWKKIIIRDIFPQQTDENLLFVSDISYQNLILFFDLLSKFEMLFSDLLSNFAIFFRSCLVKFTIFFWKTVHFFFFFTDQLKKSLCFWDAWWNSQ